MYWEVVGNHMWRVWKASQIPPPPHDSDSLPHISFIIGFKALECIKRYWETICEESR